MSKTKGLVIIHVDGLGYHYLQKALQQGRMPFVQSLIDHEGYQALRYRCGVPSTTPFCQAGILYGDNSEIPSFRWKDKQSGVAVSFGGLSSFDHVAHKYFHHRDPLTSGGASIATCYPGSNPRSASRAGYREHGHSIHNNTFSYKHVIGTWATNPIHLLDWVRRGIWEILKGNVQYIQARLSGRPVAETYWISDMLEEILLHHLTRFAVIQAMREKYPVIYGAFYAYDETAHAFGPEADYSFRILRHIDHTIRSIADCRCLKGDSVRDYELVLLSDHGQVETIPFDQEHGQRLGELVANWLPTYEVQENKGKRVKRQGAIDGHVELFYSGGLAHLYFRDISWRLRHAEIEERFPGLVDRAARAPGIAFVMTREGGNNILTTAGHQYCFEAGTKLSRGTCDWLGQYDEPRIVARQLAKLNSFERSGDLILFSNSAKKRQVNFENQVGGHGSLYGEQKFPFILVKREWDFDTSNVIDSSDINPMLVHLLDGLAA